jgi:hypothetical protein
MMIGDRNKKKSGDWSSAGVNWVLISQKTAFFIVTAVRPSNLT